MEKLSSWFSSLKKDFSRIPVIGSLRPPSFMDEYKDQYVQTVWYIFSVGGAVCFYLAIFFGLRRFWLHCGIAVVLTIVIGSCLVLIKKGQVHLSTAIVFSIAYIAALVGVLFERGLNDIGVQAIYPIFFLIGAFLNRRAAAVFGAITLIWIVVLIYLDSIGFYTGRLDRYDPITKGLITGSVFVLAALVMRYTIQKTLLVNHNLNIAKKEAEQANKLKSLFLANMSHELRTPLNAIIGYSEGILEENEMMNTLDEDTVEDISRIQLSGRHLLTLINDILDLSKIEADKMVVSLENFNLFELINEIVDIIQPTAEKNNTAIKFLNDFQNISLVSDRQKIKQALLNLLSNATKYTQHGEVSILVSTIEPSNIKIEVSDTGIGISKEELPYIFDSFRQVDSSLSRTFTGTGLGLAITKRMVEILEGNLQAESEEGKGSKFTLILPIEPINESKLITSHSTYDQELFEPSQSI